MEKDRSESFASRARAITNQMHYHHGTYTVSHKDTPLTPDERIEQEMKDTNPNPLIHGEPIKQSQLKLIMEEELEKYESNNIFDTEASKTLCDDIKTRLKQITQSRYKFIVHVTSGNCVNQGLRVVSSCLWETNQDRTYSVQCRSNKHFTVVTAYLTSV